MKIKEKVPYLGSEKEKEKGQVRLLGKIGEKEDFKLSDFNPLVKSSIETMDENREGESVLLQDDTAKEINKEDLMERHLSYRVEVREGNVSDDGNNNNMAEESRTFKVILRAQPNEAIEINGPYEIAYPYKEAVKETFINRNGEEVTFQNILDR